MAKLKLYIIKNILRGFKNGMTITDICEKSGIARSVFYDWCRRWPRFSTKCDELKMSRIILVEDAMFKSALAGDVNAQKNIMLNYRKGWRLGDPKDHRPAVVVQNNLTQNNTPAQKIDDEEELRRNANLIRKFSLVDKYGGEERQSIVPGVLPEGQQRSESDQRSDTPGDSGTHSAVQET